MKLTGCARAHYYQRYTDTDDPTLLHALAFGAKYEEAKLLAGNYKFKWKPGCYGKEVTRALAAALQEMYDASIPVIRSAADDQY